MARFSGNIFGAENMENENEIKKCSVYLQECLTLEELQQLRDDYNSQKQPEIWWKYVFEHVNVSYNK